MTLACIPNVDVRAGRVDVSGTVGTPVVWQITADLNNPRLMVVAGDGTVVYDVSSPMMETDIWLAYLTAADTAALGVGAWTWILVDGGDVVVGGQFTLSGAGSWTDVVAGPSTTRDGVLVEAILPAMRLKRVLLWMSGAGTLPGPPAVMDDAVLFLDARYSEVGEPRAINQGTGGTALNAKYGSVLGAYIYDGAVWTPRLGSNGLSVPDAAALDITGPIEIVVRVSSDNWALNQDIVGKYSAGTGYLLRNDSSGRFAIYCNAYGGGQFSTAHGLVNDVTYWMKMAYDTATGVVSWYKAADQATEPTLWTLISSGGATPGAMTANTQTLTMGYWTGGVDLAGRIYRTIIRNGIGGSTVLDVDLANVADYATTFTAVTGQTVTVNSTSADTNDPLFLPHTGDNYVRFPGSGLNGLSVPDAANLDITGDIEFVFRASSVDWTSGAAQTFLIKWQIGGDGSYAASIRADGFLYLTWLSPTIAYPLFASAAVPFVDGATYWIKMTLDVDNGAGGHTVRFYYAADQASEPSSWTQIGTDVVTAGIAAINPTTHAVLLGQRTDGAEGLNGTIRRAIVRDGIGGTTVLDVNAATDVTSAGATTFTATSGQTVTVNRSTSGRKTALVTRPIWLLGTDDYLEVADNVLLDFGAAESFTVMSVNRRWPSINQFGRMVSKGSSPGWYLANTTINNPALWGVINDGTNNVQSQQGTGTIGALSVCLMERNVDLDSLRMKQNSEAFGSTTDTTTGSLGNAISVFVGSSAGASFLDHELVAVAVWRRVLTVDEIAEINDYYGTV